VSQEALSSGGTASSSSLGMKLSSHPFPLNEPLPFEDLQLLELFGDLELFELFGDLELLYLLPLP
jgi:hypothetical protein